MAKGLRKNLRRDIDFAYEFKERVNELRSNKKNMIDNTVQVNFDADKVKGQNKFSLNELNFIDKENVEHIFNNNDNSNVNLSKNKLECGIDTGKHFDIGEQLIKSYNYMDFETSLRENNEFYLCFIDYCVINIKEKKVELSDSGCIMNDETNVESRDKENNRNVDFPEKYKKWIRNLVDERDFVN